MSVRPPRWRASRAGIINIYEYGEQVFEFGGGRLALRGPNGAGKSKAMELLFPFLFEGDMTARKLDPFGKTARRMKWNLLMDDRYLHRIGYSWLELRHDDPRHSPEYATFGVCLDVHKDWDDVRPRFFYVPDKRVGHDFRLVGDDKRPLNRQQLHEIVTRLGGETFVRANEYQERLNQVAFGYPSVKRLTQQVRLQRVLRKPQLSDSLDETLLNELLSDALPEIDSELLERSSRRLEHIEESRVRLDTLKRNAKAVGEFSVTYANYARAELRERRDALRDAVDALSEAQMDHDDCEYKLTETHAQLTETRIAVEAAEAGLVRLRGALETLLSSPEMKAAEEIARAREVVRKATDALELRNGQLNDAEDRLARQQESRDEQERLLSKARARFAAELERLEGLAEAAGIDAHAQVADQLAGDEPVGPLVEQLERAVRARHQAIERVRGRRRSAEDKERFARRQGEKRELARMKAGDAADARADAERGLDGERNALAERLNAWLEGVQELDVPAPTRERLDEVADSAGAPEAERVADILSPVFAAAVTLHERSDLELNRRGEALADERMPLVAEKAELEAETDPAPAPLPIRAPREEGRLGAPLWQLVDFNDGLDADERAGLEGALEGAGLLDAWVTPTGEVLAPGSDDVALIPSEIGAGRGPTLADRLRPAAGGLPVDAAVVGRILRSIGVSTSEEQDCVVAPDGSFAFGPARGAHPKERAQFIGASARADNRTRRIAEIDAALGEIARKERLLAGERDALAARRARAQAERECVPCEQRVRQAYSALVRAGQDADGARREFEAAEANAIDAEREADLARGEVELLAGRHGLDPSGAEESLKAAEERLERYAGALGELRSTDSDSRGALALVEQLNGQVADAKRHLGEREEDVATAKADLDTAEGRIAGLAALSEGAEHALERQQELKTEIEKGVQDVKGLSGRQNKLTGEAASLESKLETAAGKVGEAEEKRDTAIVCLRSYVRAELLPLALAERGLAPVREQTLAWDCDEWLAFFESVKGETLSTRAQRETLQNSLDRDYETLFQQVDSSQLQISRERVSDGLLLVVRGYAHGSEQPLATLIESLNEEVTDSERRLSEADRSLFEEFVTGGLVDHLHARINEAKEAVERMNEEIAKVEASSGMSIAVRWQRSEDGGPTLRRALELLQGAPSRLSANEQQELQEFIREQVKMARLESEKNETILAQLGNALDYRRWHNFKLRKTNLARGVAARDLTRHEHESGSGGEKAIALHLPLLAAAASYPSSGKPEALRMVMLDEAFTRIDEEGRRGIMGLIAKFDLDLMLTSPDFWGCYDEVPELSIYALAPPDKRFPGVVTRHFQWDGKRKTLIDEPVSAADAKVQERSLLVEPIPAEPNGNRNGHINPAELGRALEDPEE
jgi:uncharacterized protein (TIGR02680 family)